MRASRFLFWLFAAALAGIAVFAVLVWRAVDVTDARPVEAARQFDDARRAFGEEPPLLARQADGSLVRRSTVQPDAPEPIAQVSVLSYDVATNRLTRADVPFWFFRLKAPAAQFIVRDTGLDLSTLGITAAELAREGPALVLDETDARGSRLLVWTQ